MITRRHVLRVTLLGAVAPSLVCAQGRRVTIGMLGPSPYRLSVYAGGIVQGFAELGYRDGARAKIEYRSSDGKPELYRSQAEELVVLNCDIFIAVGAEPPVRSLQALKPRAPILFLAVDYDPVEQRVVSDLRRPDRNTTGVYVPQYALVAKRVEIMRELLPRAKRMVVFADTFSEAQVDAARKATGASGFEIMLVAFQRQPYDYLKALETARKEGADAFMNLASPVFARDREHIKSALLALRMPSIGSNPLQGEAGFLLSLGVNVPKVTKRVADLGVRLLNGTPPSEIPVEQADEFDLLINANTAKALGVRVPESVLARATRIVQ